MLRGVGRYIRQHHLALIALFVALSGTAYATSKIGPNDIAKNAVRSKHIKNGQVKLSDTNDKLRLKCPGGTRYYEGACIETAARGGGAAAGFGNARQDCLEDGRRLPTLGELENFRLEPGITLSSAGEWTSVQFEDYGGPPPGAATRGMTIDDAGATAIRHLSVAENPYRCVARAKR